MMLFRQPFKHHQSVAKCIPYKWRWSWLNPACSPQNWDQVSVLRYHVSVVASVVVFCRVTVYWVIYICV